MRPLAQQLDMEGRLHDLPPAHEAPRLFTPAPIQLAGQLDTSDTVCSGVNPPPEEADMSESESAPAEDGVSALTYMDDYSDRADVIGAAAANLARGSYGEGGTENERRADWGEAAAMIGCPDYAIGGNGIETDISDALANIAHFCARAGVDAQELFARGLRAASGDLEDGPEAKRRRGFGAGA
jgi:hypothetical protein